MGCCAAKASAPAKATYALLERSPSDTAEQVPDLEEPSSEVDLPRAEVDSEKSQRDSHTDDEQLKEHASAGFHEEFLKKGKLAWTQFKTSRFGVFLLERWLPLQDTSLDLLVTFGKQGWPLCSDDGLIWTNDVWWARISVGLIASTFVVWFALITPIVVKQFRRHCGACFAMLLWAMCGLPSLAAADILFLCLWPTSSPQQAWIANVMRLRVLTETLLESPGQALLQSRMFYVKVMTNRMDLEKSKVATLAVSIGTSIVCMGLTLKDINDLARSQNMSLCACLLDSLLVGLEWRAPLLHLLKSKQAVDFIDQGPLSDEHLQQIGAVLADATNLSECSFVEQNFGKEGLEQLWPNVEILCKKNANFVFHIGGFGGTCQYSAHTLTIKNCASVEHTYVMLQSPVVKSVEVVRVAKDAFRDVLKVLEDRRGLRRLRVKDMEINTTLFTQMAAVIEKLKVEVELEEVHGSIVFTAQQAKEKIPLIPRLIPRRLFLAAQEARKTQASDLTVAVSWDKVGEHGRSQMINLLDSQLQASHVSRQDLEWIFSTEADHITLEDPEFDIAAIKRCLERADRLRKRMGVFKLQISFGIAAGQLPTGDAVLACSGAALSNMIGASWKTLPQTFATLHQLTHLVLEFTNQNLGDQGATAVAESLGKLVNLNHVELDFTSNKLGAQGATAVAESVGKLVNLNHVVLNFQYNRLGAQGATAVAQSLGKLVNLNHVELNFDDNSLGDPGATAVAESLGELVNLNHVVLNFDSNRLGAQGATAVAKSLGKLVNLNHVVLNFAFNNLGAQGATAVAESVGKLENLNHVVLNFENIGLGAQGATAVAQSLGKLVNLNHVQLNFNGNSLGDQGRRALKSLEEQVAARCSIKV